MLANGFEAGGLLLAALAVGSMVCIWLCGNPTGMSGSAYAAHQQHLIRGLNVALPAMGMLASVLTVGAAVFAREDRSRLILLLAGAACLVGCGLITRLLNQPINAIVVGWPVDAPPSNWAQLRDAWWKWHVLRTAIGVLSLCLLIASTLKRELP